MCSTRVSNRNPSRPQLTTAQRETRRAEVWVRSLGASPPSPPLLSAAPPFVSRLQGVARHPLFARPSARFDAGQGAPGGSVWPGPYNSFVSGRHPLVGEWLPKIYVGLRVVKMAVCFSYNRLFVPTPSPTSRWNVVIKYALALPPPPTVPRSPVPHRTVKRWG